MFPDLWLGECWLCFPESMWVTGSLFCPLPLPSCKPHCFGAVLHLITHSPSQSWCGVQMSHNFNWGERETWPWKRVNSCAPGGYPGWIWVGEDSPSQKEEWRRRLREKQGGRAHSGFLMVPRSCAFLKSCGISALGILSFFHNTQPLKCRLCSNWSLQIPITYN